MIQSEYKYKEVAESKMNRLQLEKEVLGRYITGHPLDGHEEEMKKFTFDSSMFVPIEAEPSEEEEEEEHEEEYPVKNGDNVYFGGVLSDVIIKVNPKSGKKWAAGVCEDLSGSFDVVFFGNAYNSYKQLIHDDALVKIRGKVSIVEGGKPKIEAQSVYGWGLEEKEEAPVDSRVLCIRIDNDIDMYNKVMDLLGKYRGEGCGVKIQLDGKLYNLGFTVMGVDSLKNALIGIVGYQNVKIITPTA